MSILASSEDVSFSTRLSFDCNSVCFQSKTFCTAKAMFCSVLISRFLHPIEGGQELFVAHWGFEIEEIFFKS